MKKFVAVFCLLLCAATLQAKDKPNPADYTIKAHISSSHLETEYSGGIGHSVLYVDTILNGKKVKLEGALPVHIHLATFIIVPGDYQIRLKRDLTEKDSGTLSQEYELLLPNGDTWECWIVGISE